MMVASTLPCSVVGVIWTAVPWLVWIVLSAVIIAIVAFTGRRRVRWALFAAVAIACALALWPPYPGGRAKGGARLTLQVATVEAVQARRDDALAGLRNELGLKGIAYGAAVRTGDAALAIEGVEPARQADARTLCAGQLGPDWSIAADDTGRIEAHLAPQASEALQRSTRALTRRGLDGRLRQLDVDDFSVGAGPAADEVEVDLFGVGDLEAAKRVVLTSGKLALRLVEDQALTREALLEQQGGRIPEDGVVLTGPGEPGETVHYLLRAEPVITSRDLKNARASVDQFDQPAVFFTLNEIGAKRFGQFTARHIGRQLAIVLDGQVQSAPKIESKIGAYGQITGRFTTEEADALARVLRAGALPVSLRVLREVALPPAKISRSMLRAAAATALAFLAAGLVVLLFYRAPAFVAALVLICAVVVTLAAMAVLQRTVTLPGVAILVLAVGVVLDRALSQSGAD
jgi:protein-export membrane protein SecD